ncbi:MAG: hypothetical protein GX613_08930 [Chloroflexi bacterium]|jgi:hypothetical protein|nr:hypothetical protein [Chloroflexota bacterium]
MNRQRILIFILVFVSAFALTGDRAFSQDGEQTLTEDLRRTVHDIRLATRDFRDVDAAIEAGYGVFLDCFTGDGTGDMGQHYVHGDLVGDDVLDPLQPEALVYEPLEDGSLTLVALEYLVFEDQWTAEEPPMLFEREFHLKTDIPETPPVWALHIWLWTHNPNGMFEDYNPTVFCPDAS